VLCRNILDAIGGTPLVRLAQMAAGLPVELYGKVEALNPGGSSKDRLAAFLVDRAEARGLLKPGATLVEASAGNTGIGLAMVAAVRGYRCLIVVPYGTSPIKTAIVRAYGAEVVVAGPDEDFCEVATRLATDQQGFRPDQFHNRDNPEAHASSTADELWRDLDGRIDAVVAVCGTGGTLAGIGRALRVRNPQLRLVRALPVGDDGGESRVEGIAPEGPPPEFECPGQVEELVVCDSDAIEAARRLARTEAILVGASGGAALAGAVRWSATAPAGSRVVVILPDTGRNYAPSL